jgi:hypothetical protein
VHYLLYFSVHCRPGSTGYRGQDLNFFSLRRRKTEIRVPKRWHAPHDVKPGDPEPIIMAGF